MPISRSIWVPLILLAAIVPLLPGARLVSPEEEALSSPVGAGMLLATATIPVTDEPKALKQSLTLPETARWARVKNVSAAIVYVSASSTSTANESWPLGPGEDISFSLATDVYLMTAAGAISVPVLIGR
jgi:hypothetical protein